MFTIDITDVHYNSKQESDTAEYTHLLLLNSAVRRCVLLDKTLGWTLPMFKLVINGLFFPMQKIGEDIFHAFLTENHNVSTQT